MDAFLSLGSSVLVVAFGLVSLVGVIWGSAWLGWSCASTRARRRERRLLEQHAQDLRELRNQVAGVTTLAKDTSTRVATLADRQDGKGT